MISFKFASYCRFAGAGLVPALRQCPNLFYVAFQIIGKYLLFINCSISTSYTYLQVYDDF